MESVLKFLGIAALAVLVLGVLALVAVIGFLLISLIITERQPPERTVLLDTTFRGARIRYEELAKTRAGAGMPEYQLLLSLNGKCVWSAGADIDPSVHMAKYYVVPVHPEDLQNVVAIRHLTPLASPPQPSVYDSSLEDITRYVVSTMSGTAMWLSPKEMTREEFDLLGDFLEAHRQDAMAQQKKPLFYYDALVYADESRFAPRKYVQKTAAGERTITIDLDGSVDYSQDGFGDSSFGQTFGRLDSTTKILYAQLLPPNARRPLRLTKEEIEAFTDANGNALGARYTVEILPHYVQKTSKEYVETTPKGERIASTIHFERIIAVDLDGAAYYYEDCPGAPRHQRFGRLDRATNTLYAQLAADGNPPLNLTKEEIEAFVDAKGNALSAHYTVEIIPHYVQKTSNGERVIGIDLDGTAYYSEFERDDKGRIMDNFSQPFGHLDRTTNTLYVKLVGAKVHRLVKLAKEDIVSFTDAKGNALGARYAVEVLPHYFQNTAQGERVIRIDLDGTAHYFEYDVVGQRLGRVDTVTKLLAFHQPFGRLDRATNTLYAQLAGERRTLNLTKEDIEAFADANGSALGARYAVKILPPEASRRP